MCVYKYYFLLLETLVSKVCLYVVWTNFLVLNYYIFFNRKWLRLVFENIEFKYNSIIQKFSFADKLDVDISNGDTSNKKFKLNTVFSDLHNKIMNVEPSSNDTHDKSKSMNSLIEQIKPLKSRKKILSKNLNNINNVSKMIELQAEAMKKLSELEDNISLIQNDKSKCE